MHFLELVVAASRGVEEVQFVKCSDYLVALLSDIVFSKHQGCLGKLQEIVLLFQLLGSLKGNMDVATSNSEVKPLFQIRFEEQSDL